MFLQQNTRWKAKQWLLRFRGQILWIAACAAVLSAGSFLGVFQDFESSVERTLYEIRGPVETAEPMSVVHFDDAFQSRETFPYDAETVFTVIDRVAADDAKLIIVPIVAGVLSPPTSEIACPPSAFFFGPTRPSWLPADCTWGIASDPSEARRLFQNRFAGDFGEVNWSGAISTISATHLADRKFLPGAFDNHTVVVDLLPQSLSKTAMTPYGEISGQMIFAEELSSRIDGRTVHKRAWINVAFLLLSLLVGIWGPRLRFAKIFATSVAVSMLLATYFLFSQLQIITWVFVPQLTLLATFLCRRIVPERFDRSQSEAEDRLKDAIAASESRRPRAAETDAEFWSGLMERASKELKWMPGSLGELKPGDWWIQFKAFHQMSEEHIQEQRRDVRRSPYEKPFSNRQIETVSNYHQLKELSTIMIPLVNENKFVGFWMLHTDSPETVLEEFGRKIKRIANQFAYEIRLHQLNLSSSKQNLGRRELSAEHLAQTALVAMDQIESDRKTLDQLVESTHVGLMIVDQFGDVIYENGTMSKILAVDASRSSVHEIFAGAFGDSIDDFGQTLESALETGDGFEVSLTMNPDGQSSRVFAFRFQPIASRDTRQSAHYLSVSAFDVTRFVNLEDERIALSEKVAERARDSLAATQAYISAIPKLGGGDNAIIGLSAVVQDVERAVTDFQMLVDPQFASDADALYSLQSVVRNAILSAEESSQLQLDAELPNELVVARGSADVIERAIKLLITDAISLSSGAAKLQISVTEEGREVVVRVSIENSTIPNAMLQRLLEATVDESAEEQRLAAAREYVKNNRGELSAESNDDGLLEFTVRLPRDDRSS